MLEWGRKTRWKGNISCQIRSRRVIEKETYQLWYDRIKIKIKLNGGLIASLIFKNFRDLGFFFSEEISVDNMNGFCGKGRTKQVFDKQRCIFTLRSSTLTSPSLSFLISEHCQVLALETHTQWPGRPLALLHFSLCFRSFSFVSFVFGINPNN